jgi:hypothetical protein
VQWQGRWELLLLASAPSTPLPLSTTWAAAAGQVLEPARQQEQLAPQVSLDRLLLMEQQHQQRHPPVSGLQWTLQPLLLCMAMVAARSLTVGAQAERRVLKNKSRVSILLLTST